MIRSFTIGKKFERRINGELFTTLDFVKTESGQVVAFEKNGSGQRSTVVPGFYLEELPANFGLRRIRVRTVPYEQRDDISEILVEKGYAKPIHYWYR